MNCFNFKDCTATLSSKLNFDHMELLQDALQSQVQPIIASPSNTPTKLETLKELADSLGVTLDLSANKTP